MFKLVLEKAEEPEIKLSTSIEKPREFQKNIYFSFIDYTKVFDCVDHNILWKILQEMEYQTTLPGFWEICMEVKKQQLELDMEQQTGSKSGKEYTKAVFCQPAYLTYIMWNFPWVGKIPWWRAQQPTPLFLPGESHGRGAWQVVVYRVTKSLTWLKPALPSHGRK